MPWFVANRLALAKARPDAVSRDRLPPLMERGPPKHDAPRTSSPTIGPPARTDWRDRWRIGPDPTKAGYDDTSETPIATKLGLVLKAISAERGGFEPPIQFDPYSGLANRRFRPLSHLSRRLRVTYQMVRRVVNTSHQLAKRAKSLLYMRDRSSRSAPPSIRPGQYLTCGVPRGMSHRIHCVTPLEIKSSKSRFSEISRSYDQIKGNGTSWQNLPLCMLAIMRDCLTSTQTSP